MRGTKRATTKLTECAVQEIRRMKQTHSQRKIAAVFSVSRELVRGIHKGKVWGWLTWE